MAAVLAAFLSFSSCLKEPALPARFSGTSLPSMAALSRSGSGEFSPEEQAAIEEHLQGVANFRAQVRAGPSSGNQPRKGVVVSKIVYGVHQLFPLPYNAPIPYPQMYNIPTFGTSLQNLHYNSIAYGDSVPPWNCLTPQQVDNFISGNFALAQNGKQYVPPVKIITHFFDRPWVCTRVVHDVGGSNSTDQGSKWQQHIVEHYFAVVALPTTPGETLPIREM